MGVLQKVSNTIPINYSVLGINNYEVIPTGSIFTCIDHIVYNDNVYALCVYNGKLRAINPDDLVYEF